MPTSRHSLLDDATALNEALADLVRTYQFRDRDGICCYDISVTQCYALEAMVSDGPMRLNALAKRLFLDKSTSSRVIDALVRKGYAQRLEDPKDSRAILLRVTPRGRALCRQIQTDMIEQQAQMIADLAPPARRAALEVITRIALAAKRRFGLGAEYSTQSRCCAASA